MARDEVKYTPKQIAALLDAEVAIAIYREDVVTEEEWDQIAARAYEPSLEPPEFRNGKDTKQLYKHGEEWDDERSKLHTKILKKLVSAKPGQDQPTLIVLGGGAASGKSSLRKQAIAEYPDAVVIDPDDFKLQLPEYAQFQKSDPLRAAARVHEESSDLTKAALGAALDQGNDIILDTVSGNPKKVAELIKKFASEGYVVQVRFVDAKLDIAMARMAARAKSTGRWVPPYVLVQGHYGAAATYFRVKALVASAEVWDNSDPPPEKLAENNGAETVYNRERYDEYRAKAGQHE